MKKQLKAILIIGPILVASLVAFAIILPYLSSPTGSQSIHVNIYVNSSIQSSIDSELNQYKQDILKQNYTVDIISWSSKNSTLLRDHILNASKQPKGIFGAIFIGEMPWMYLRNTDPLYGVETFPCDLYFMDLDGQWGNINLIGPDYYVDGHNSGTGDLLPEIWVARINPEILNNINSMWAYKSYFKRNHDYRNGNLTRPHSQLLYIDDDWASSGQAWLNDMTAYSSVTLANSTTGTNATDFLNQITQDYEFVHLFAHSIYNQHSFGPAGDTSDGIITSTDILNTVTKPLFYNLYCCYACRFTGPNNLGTQYLFSNNTLAVVGSTKSGGMQMNSYFYNPLNQGKVFGEALRLWFSNPLHGPSDPLSMGMTILGDPLLTI